MASVGCGLAERLAQTLELPPDVGAPTRASPLLHHHQGVAGWIWVDPCPHGAVFNLLVGPLGPQSSKMHVFPLCTLIRVKSVLEYAREHTHRAALHPFVLGARWAEELKWPRPSPGVTSPLSGG